LAMIAAMTACTVPQHSLGAGEAFDPFEARNRKTHEFNKSIDRAFFRGKSDTTEDEDAVRSNGPTELGTSIVNFSDNLSQPGVVVNKLLQGKLDDAVLGTYRFVTNTVLGFGGLVD